MRVLSGRPDHVRGRATQAHAEANRQADRRGDGRQHLPLRDLHAYPRRDQASRGQAGRCAMSAPVVDRVLRSVSDDSVVLANVSRRRFLKGMSLGGLVLAVGLQSTARAQEPKKYGADGMPNGWTDNPLAFVSIAEDGTVTIVCHRSEMGQGVRTGMPMIVADELEADWKRVRVAQAPGDEKKFGNQDTDGSRSTRHFFEPMRRCGAAARAMLEAAALKVPGVMKVVQIEPSPPPAHFNPLGGVAVLARNTWAAMQGRQALKITWDDGPNASYDSTAYKAGLEDSTRKPAKVVRNDGNFDTASSGAAKRLTAE